jgi:hypothetical protein
MIRGVLSEFIDFFASSGGLIVSTSLVKQLNWHLIHQVFNFWMFT